MYNHKAIVSCLRGLIGFERSYNLEVPDIDADLSVSSSGTFVGQGAHPLLSYENLLDVAERFAKTTVRAYEANITYNESDIVKEGNLVYRSLKNSNNGHTPASSADWWAKTTLISAYLRKVYDNAGLKLFNTLFTEKKLNEVAKTVLGNVRLYEGVGNITGRIIGQGRAVGYKITLSHFDTVAALSQIGLQLDTVQELDIYLYHSSSPNPVKVFSINQTRAIQFQWHNTAEEILSFLNAGQPAGGAYYLVYYEDDLVGSAIQKDISFSGRVKCGTCTEQVANWGLYSQWSKFISVQPFYVNSAHLPDDRTLWEEDREIEVKNTTWGLNLQMAVQCDVSALICQNRNALVNALGQQLVVDLLQAMAYSLRDNHHKEKIAGLAAVALDNQENGQQGEQKKLQAAIKALSFDFSNLSPACLPCDNAARGYTKSSVWG